MSQDDAEEAEKSSEEVISKLPTMPQDMRIKIQDLYQNLLNRFYTKRAQRCLNDFHRTNFIHGIWSTIIQCRQSNITKDGLDEEFNAEQLDLFYDLVHNNVLFFLTDFDDEAQEIGKTAYIDFIKNNI